MESERERDREREHNLNALGNQSTMAVMYVYTRLVPISVPFMSARSESKVCQKLNETVPYSFLCLRNGLVPNSNPGYLKLSGPKQKALHSRIHIKVCNNQVYTLYRFGVSKCLFATSQEP